MKRGLILALLLGGCATPQPGEAFCDVEVSFGSYAMGIDTALAERVRDAVNADPGVEEVEETNWGREGETTLCIVTSNDAAADRIYERIAEMIPQYSDRAPTTVTHHDGRTHSSGMPPGRN